MLIQIICEKNRALGGLSPARRIFKFRWSYFYRLSPFEFAFCPSEWFAGHLFWPSFTTVSMVLWTGLSTQPVATTYNVWGQLICMLLIQIGGLGLMTFIGSFIFRKQSSVFAVVKLFRKALVTGDSVAEGLYAVHLLTTFLVEGLGAFLLSFRLFLSLAGDEAFSPLSFSHFSLCNAGLIISAVAV